MVRQIEGYKAQNPELADHLQRMQTRQLPEGWDQNLPEFPADAKGMAGRVASGKVLNAIAGQVPWLIGGSADLAPSTNTLLTFEGAGDFSAADYSGRNFHFGVGEDGPTHQPVEQIASLRAVPGLIVLRPADANEVVEAWRLIMQLRREPVALILTRQNLPTLDRSRYASASGLAKGAYVLADAEDGQPEVLLLATGSEVSMCVEAYEQLKTEGIKARVVSMPSCLKRSSMPLESKWQAIAIRSTVSTFKESILALKFPQRDTADPSFSWWMHESFSAS